MSAERREAMERFLAIAGWAGAERTPLPGDASTRRYMRLVRGGHGAMLMDQPAQAESPAAPADASPEARAELGYNAMARLAGADCARFVAVARYLRGRGLSAPDIYAADTKNGFLLLEDLGDALYADAIADGAEECALYGAAVDALAELHAEAAPEALDDGVPLFAYDETAMLAETDLLTEWFLPLALGREAAPEEAAEHRELWRDALARQRAGWRVVVHRDFHAQNLLWLPQREGLARVGMIDFQDAVAGAPAYDMISLLEDARRDVAPEHARALRARYIARTGADREAFAAEAALLAAQRNAKIIGIFARLAVRDRKPRYLAHLPRVWRYMEGDLAHPALGALKAWYDKTIAREVRFAPRLGGDT